MRNDFFFFCLKVLPMQSEALVSEHEWPWGSCLASDQTMGGRMDGEADEALLTRQEGTMQPSFRPLS